MKNLKKYFILAEDLI